ncbi:MAG: gamma-glutamyltransferase [Candidatus Parabeggiatoa sp. nov. 2]|nr:MAG: gamma-glutamyltransferase [Beggiatoa sp. 4572_84]
MFISRHCPWAVFFLIVGLMLVTYQAFNHTDETLTNAKEDQPEHTHYRRVIKTSYMAKDFMVAAANPYATQVGYDVLKMGGSAVDAAVAVQLMLTLVEPQASGIGGGAFLLYWNAKDRHLTTFDGRETAPIAATPDYFKDPDGKVMAYWEAVPGGKSVGVPGTVRLLEAAHQKYGLLRWADLFKPTIALAEKGFPISPRLAASIKSNCGKKKQDQFPAARAYFFNPDGSPKEAGTTLKNTELADTLKLIAAQGAEVFYKGPIAKDIVNTIKNAPMNPGIMTEADMAAYQIKERTPVCLNYHDYKVCGMGPPTSGGLTVGQILGILNHFDLKNMGYGVDAVHLFLESAKLAYADRELYMADADYVNVPSDGLLDANYLKDRASLINRQTAMKEAKPGTPPQQSERWAPDKSQEQPGTSHFVIRDKDGNIVSMTTTIETAFGSRLMVRGFLLNNELTDFSRNPEQDGKPVANRVEGGKRPRSSMSPTIVFKDNEPYLAIGSPGGSRIINYVAKTIIAVIDWGMLPQEAINLGHFTNRNGPTDLEEGTGAVAFKQSLEARGHEVKVRDLNSGLHAILMQDGKLYGGADPRREGLVMGD